MDQINYEKANNIIDMLSGSKKDKDLACEILKNMSSKNELRSNLIIEISFRKFNLDNEHRLKSNMFNEIKYLDKLRTEIFGSDKRTNMWELYDQLKENRNDVDESLFKDYMKLNISRMYRFIKNVEIELK